MKDALSLRKIDFRVIGSSFLSATKFLIFAFHVAIFILSHVILSLIIRDEKKRLRLILKSNAFHAGLVLKYLGIETFEDEVTPLRGKLIVCNHMSYLDVLVLFKSYPALFITSKDIERTPVLGQITKLAGCFFTERKKELRTPEASAREINLMKKRLSEGFNIFLFPEGTSSDGSVILPFKAHFFQLAIDTQTPVIPLVMKYLGANRNIAPWYGDMDFVPHFLQVCAEKDFAVSVHQLGQLSPSGRDKFQLKNEAEMLIRESYEKY